MTLLTSLELAHLIVMLAALHATCNAHGSGHICACVACHSVMCRACMDVCACSSEFNLEAPHG